MNDIFVIDYLSQYLGISVTVIGYIITALLIISSFIMAYLYTGSSLLGRLATIVVIWLAIFIGCIPLWVALVRS